MQAFSSRSTEGGAQLPASAGPNEGNNGATEAGIRANSAEAHRLFQRGVAAARGGQRRVAVGLLTRSVQLDPRNERAWLWLSGVLDDPHQIAFCLRAVLKLDPENTRAQQGLRWLEERQILKQPPRAAPMLDVPLEEPPAQREAREHGESWWVNWRRTRREMRRAQLLLWIVPVVLLSLALLLHQAFAVAVEQSNKPPPIAAVISSGVMPEIDVNDQAAPLLESELVSVRQGKLLSYLGTIDTLRQQLRTSVDSYRNATTQPGGTSVAHASAAQRLRDQVEQAHAQMAALTPPTELEQAHASYLKGLELEVEALNALLEFYSSYEVKAANRAALNFQEANGYINQARAEFERYARQLGLINSVPVHTPR